MQDIHKHASSLFVRGLPAWSTRLLVRNPCFPSSALGFRPKLIYATLNIIQYRFTLPILPPAYAPGSHVDTQKISSKSRPSFKTFHPHHPPNNPIDLSEVWRPTDPWKRQTSSAVKALADMRARREKPEMKLNNFMLIEEWFKTCWRDLSTFSGWWEEKGGNLESKLRCNHPQLEKKDEEKQRMWWGEWATIEREVLMVFPIYWAHIFHHDSWVDAEERWMVLLLRAFISVYTIPGLMREAAEAHKSGWKKTFSQKPEEKCLCIRNVRVGY